MNQIILWTAGVSIELSCEQKGCEEEVWTEEGVRQAHKPYDPVSSRGVKKNWSRQFISPSGHIGTADIYIYVCVCVCVCVYTYVYMYIYIYICVCVYIFISISIYI